MVFHRGSIIDIDIEIINDPNIEINADHSFDELILFSLLVSFFIIKEIAYLISGPIALAQEAKHETRFPEIKGSNLSKGQA